MPFIVLPVRPLVSFPNIQTCARGYRSGHRARGGGARGASSPAALCCTAAAMVYGGASHLDASDVEREKRARQGALHHQVEREKSARVGAPTREEVEAWQLLQQDNRSDHIGPRVPEGRLPLPAPDSSSDCRLCHRTTTSTPRRTGTLCQSMSVHLPPWPLAGADGQLCAFADRAEFLAKGQLRSDSTQDDPMRRAISWFPLFFLPGLHLAVRHAPRAWQFATSAG